MWKLYDMHSQDTGGCGGWSDSVFSFEIATTFMNFEFPNFFLYTKFFPRAGKWCVLIQRGSDVTLPVS